MNKEVQYVGFWPRFLATIIDSILLSGIIYIILWFLIGPDIFNPEASYSMTQFTFESLIPFVVVMAFWITKSATPGKMLLKMRIVDSETYEKVSPSRLFLRYVAYFVSIIPLGLGLLWVAWDKKKQGWHDKIAKTVIIKSKKA